MSGRRRGLRRRRASGDWNVSCDLYICGIFWDIWGLKDIGGQNRYLRSLTFMVVYPKTILKKDIPSTMKSWGIETEERENRSFLAAFWHLCVLALMVHSNEGGEYDCCANPIHGTRILAVQKNLANQRQGNRKAQSDRYDQRRCEKHGICPTDIRNQGGDGVDLNHVSTNDLF